MRFYLSGASAEVALCQSWIRKLEAKGHECTHDWTASVIANTGKPDAELSDKERSDFAYADLHGVENADVFWLLVPPVGRSAGAWVELGAALTCESMPKVVASGDIKRSIFTSVADVCFSTHEAAFDFLTGSK